jgi:hypothetical protein
LSLPAVEPVGFYGPEYFADARQFVFSGETLYVADGIGGIKVYTSNWRPDDTLRFVGGYGTGNVVNQVARIGDNFFASDYYSLQHLRWGAPTGIEDDHQPTLPQKILLSQNYPNPVNSSTIIRYSLPQASDVRLDVYDLLGRRVATLAEGRQDGGEHAVVWDAEEMGSGVYFYRLAIGDNAATRVCTLIK